LQFFDPVQVAFKVVGVIDVLDMLVDEIAVNKIIVTNFLILSKFNILKIR
jgi:hypothetical protein